MKKTNYEKRLEENLKDPEFKAMFLEETERLRVAHQICQLRKKSKLTQSQMALKISTTQSVIARIENGKQNISLGMLMKIADALNKKVNIQFI